VLLNLGQRLSEAGLAGSMVYGLAIGGASTACSACCNPVLPVALWLSTVQGSVLLGAGMLGLFAIGYSLPLALGLVGIGMGIKKISRLSERFGSSMRYTAGAVMIGVGFYMLATA